MTSYANLTIPVSPGTASVSILGGSGGSGGVLAATTGTSYSWTQPYYNLQGTTNIQSSLVVSGNADFAGRVKIQGQDISEILEKINQRLAILTPDPKMLDKYTALREAYDHYRTLEALCVDSNENRTEE